LGHRGADRLLDVLACELAECHRFRPRRLAPPWRRFGGRGFERPPPDEGARGFGVWEAVVFESVASVCFGRGTGASTGAGAQRGCQPKSGNRLPQPMMRYCWITRYAVYTTQ